MALPVRLEDMADGRAHVIVAVEDPGLRVQIEETLLRDGYRVSSVEDGVELLEALSDPEIQNSTHLVVADVELSGFTGLEILGMTDGSPTRPPVLLVGIDVDLEMRRAARQFGAASILPRSFDVDELRLVAGALLRPAYRGAVLRAA